MEIYSLFKKQQCLTVLCLVFAFTNFLKTAVAKAQAHQSPIPFEKEVTNNGLQGLRLAYADDHIALFFESGEIIPQLVFTPVPESDAWKFKDKINYTTSTGKDPPTIYVIKHEPKHSNINKMQKSQLTSPTNCNYQHISSRMEDDTTDPLADGHHFASKIKSEVEPVKKALSQSYEKEINRVLEWGILDIFVYDNFLQMGNIETAQGFLEEVINTTTNFPQENVTLFSDWYLPIYENHGDSESIKKFMNLLKSYSNNDSSRNYLRNKTVNAGEFVHIWSEATGADLRDLAYKAFGWTPEYRAQYELARQTFTTYNYSVDIYPNAHRFGPPEFWEEHWEGHTSNLTSVFYDGHVSFFYDESVPSSVTWPHQLLSDSWRYAKTTYGPFGPDPILHIALHTGKHDECWKSKSNSYFDKTFDHRLVVDCEQVEADAWDAESDYNVDYLIEEVGAIITNVVKETGNWPASFHTNGNMSEILVYDIYLGMGRMADAERWMKEKQTERYNYPRKNMFWFRYWFYPIYLDYGGTKVLQGFFNLLYLHWPRKGTDYVSEMNVGEFVHFWSGAVGEDLRSLATKTLGWKAEYNDQLVQARIVYPQFNNLYTTANASLPKTWTETWKNHGEELNLVHSDDHVAIYFDANVNKSISWPFKLMSDSWKYAKQTYGPLSYDPILYIILHEKISGCSISKESSYFDADYGNRNVIDCGKESVNAWNSNSSENKDLLLSNLGLIILRNARETGNWPGFTSSHWSMGDILVYDIYRGLGMMEVAERWREKMFENTEEVPAKSMFWCRDWYYPIYEKYGQSHALNDFLSVLNANWPHEDHDYIRDYNMGEMVHFWSIAVGENLWPLVDKAFGCCTWDQKTYLKARKDFRNFNYTDTTDNSTVMIPSDKWIDREDKFNEELNLAHVDSHIAVYFDSIVDITVTWPFKPLSDAWRYAKKTYGPFEPGAILHVLLLETTINECTTSRIDSYLGDKLENRTVITCGKLAGTWKSSAGLDKLIDQLSTIVLREAKQTGNWPAWGVSKWVMSEIVAYDIFHEIGMSLEALTWLKNKFTEYVDVPHSETFWLREWFYPIYAKYGGAKVMDDFLNLLSEQWPKKPKGSGYDYVKDLNVGEFVHFWSGAAGVSLVHLANKTFGWNHEYSIQLEKATQAFPMITCNCMEDSANFEVVAESDSSPILLTEDQFEHSKLLLKAYGSSKVAVYFDADVNRNIKWPFDLLSKTWTQTNSNYDTVNTLGPILKIILHGTKQTGCKTALNLPDNSDSTSILDCGKESAWAADTAENRDDLIQGFVNLIQHSAKQTEGREPYDPKPFFEILAFDVYLRLGNLEDAHRVLKKTYHENEIQAGGDKVWIRDWYLPLYTQYGGVVILNNFVSLLSTNWTQERQDANKKINVGQTIHFWSAVAGENLNVFAEQTFGRNHLYQEQFNDARKDFPLLRYLCYHCQLQSLNQTQKSEDHTLITGISVGFVCIVIAAFVLPLVIYRSKLNSLQKQIRELTSEEIKEFFEGNDQIEQGEGHFPIESKPFNKDYEISREHLDIDFTSVLGSGEFGLVVRGRLKSTTGPGRESMDTLVAVKTVKPNVDVTYFKSMLTELKVMGFLGSHANIVSLLGAFTVNIRNREVYIALEFCSNGDLLSFLKKNRVCFKDLLIERSLEASDVKPGNSEIRISIASTEPPSVDNKGDADDAYRFSTMSLLHWARGITNGLTTRSSRNIQSIHLNSDSPGAALYVNKATVSTQNDESSNPTATRSQDSKSINSDDAFSTFDLLEWSRQIASGMAFIASKNVIHGDLAARNVLLTAGNVAKISDFGLSRQLANYSNYMKTSKTPVPWRWMAIESLRDMNFSVQSDAWSFGVTLYEIFSLGTTPYAGWTWDYEFIDKLVAGHRLSAPEFGNEDVFKLMMDCMQREPSERSSFLQVIRRLEEIKVKICPDTALNASSNYVQLGGLD